MALTNEQVKQYRQKYGLDNPETGAPIPTTTIDLAESRINSLKTAPSAIPTPGDLTSPMGQNGTMAAPVAEPKRNIFGKVLDFGKDVAKDAAKSILVKPAARTAEAIGRTGILGENIQRGYEDMAETGQDINVLGADLKIEPVKTGMAGAKQITGEALKAGSWLYGGGTGALAGKSLLGSRAGTALVQGMKAGAVSGGAYGAGDALEQDKSAGEVLKEGAIGGVVGGVAGGTVAAAPVVAKLLYKGGQAAVKAPGQVAGAIDDIGVRAREVAQRTPSAQNAIKAGIPDRTVNFIETALPDDQNAMRKMLRLAKSGMEDVRVGREQLAKRESAKPILERASHLVKVKDLSVGQTNRIINSLSQEPIDVSPILMTFFKDLQDKGVTIIKRGKGFQFANNGAIPEGDIGAYRLMLQMLSPDENGQVLRSYRGLHTARQRIFNELNLAKSRQQTFSPDVDNYAEKFRMMLLQPIDKASGGKYKASQKKTAESLGALREFVQLMGYKGDLEKLSTKDLKAAEIASRVLGKASDRPTSVIQKLDEVASKYGFKGRTSLLDQVEFNDMLEEILGTTQTGGIRGQVSRGVTDANDAITATGEAASGNILALGARGIKALMGKSKEDQIKALEQLLESNARPRTNFGR